MSTMPDNRWDALMHPASVLKLTAEEIAAGWHFCEEWDGLLIGPGWGELAYCSCLPLNHPARKEPVNE